ncbi:MAG: hemerythrin domain-containing protein [Thermomicrobiales bacterium]|nr:hemerythrin domain-containing protein [Thermomicrobiales bacterium]
MHPLIHRFVALVALLTLLGSGVGVIAGSAQEATPAASPTINSRYVPPPELPEGAVAEETLRQQLIAAKATSCADLELIAGILVSSGVLPQVPPMISALTGMPIDELEARETTACQQVGEALPDDQKSIAQLLNEANTAQWLVQIHLGAMDHVMMQNPTYRPIAAQGCFAAFFEMHNLNIETMRHDYLSLISNPTLEKGQALGQFWTEVLQPHAVAEDATLWDLARSVGDPNLTRSADLVEAEHQTIDRGIAAYMETLAAVERGEAEPAALVPLAEGLRIRTELHFGKEEVTVVRPLQQRIDDAEFRPVIEALDSEIGAWLRDNGWTMEECAG